MKLKIYTDGACSGNPGKGGWAAIILDSNLSQSSISGSESKTTNNRMELEAAIQTLEFELGGEEDETTAVNFTASTELGDGVELGLEFIQTDADLFSQAAGAGSNSTYTAEIALTVGF